jgi:hypothetical protein
MELVDFDGIITGIIMFAPCTRIKWYKWYNGEKKLGMKGMNNQQYMMNIGYSIMGIRDGPDSNWHPYTHLGIIAPPGNHKLETVPCCLAHVLSTWHSMVCWSPNPMGPEAEISEHATDICVWTKRGGATPLSTSYRWGMLRTWTGFNILFDIWEH